MKISIITITYNSAKTLRETIQSVQSQIFNKDDLEYIIVDGGSTDGTLDIIREYDMVVTKWISEPDKGISDAFNKGIRMATGELIGIINSDDMLAKNALSILNEKTKSDSDVVFGNAIMFGGGEKAYRAKSNSNLERLREQMSIVHPTTFVKKSAYEKYGMFDLKYKCAMDRELLLRMYVQGAKFQYIDEDLARMRLGGVNQRTYLKVTLPESKEISVRYGLSPWKATVRMVKNSLRFRIAVLVRKTCFASAIRRLFHARTTELDI